GDSGDQDQDQDQDLEPPGSPRGREFVSAVHALPVNPGKAELRAAAKPLSDLQDDWGPRSPIGEESDDEATELVTRRLPRPPTEGEGEGSSTQEPEPAAGPSSPMDVSMTDDPASFWAQ